MLFKDLLAGLEILKPYYDNLDREVFADYEEFYPPITDRPLSKEDSERMASLSWNSFKKYETEEIYWVAYL